MLRYQRPYPKVLDACQKLFPVDVLRGGVFQRGYAQNATDETITVNFDCRLNSEDVVPAADVFWPGKQIVERDEELRKGDEVQVLTRRNFEEPLTWRHAEVVKVLPQTIYELSMLLLEVRFSPTESRIEIMDRDDLVDVPMRHTYCQMVNAHFATRKVSFNNPFPHTFVAEEPHYFHAWQAVTNSQRVGDGFYGSFTVLAHKNNPLLTCDEEALREYSDRTFRAVRCYPYRVKRDVDGNPLKLSETACVHTRVLDFMKSSALHDTDSGSEEFSSDSASFDPIDPERSPFSLVPNEILFLIFMRLDVVDQYRLRRVCAHWKAILLDPFLSSTIYIDCERDLDGTSVFEWRTLCRTIKPDTRLVLVRFSPPPKGFPLDKVWPDCAMIYWSYIRSILKHAQPQCRLTTLILTNVMIDDCDFLEELDKMAKFTENIVLRRVWTFPWTEYITNANAEPLENARLVLGPGRDFKDSYWKAIDNKTAELTANEKQTVKAHLQKVRTRGEAVWLAVNYILETTGDIALLEGIRGPPPDHVQVDLSKYKNIA